MKRKKGEWLYVIILRSFTSRDLENIMFLKSLVISTNTIMVNDIFSSEIA